MPVLRNKWTPLQIVITNGYTCSLFQVAKIARKTEITKKGRCVKKEGVHFDTPSFFVDLIPVLTGGVKSFLL